MMSLNDYILNYTKDWRNAADFPTYETKEAKVREDMQLLFEEMKDAYNRFVIDLSARNLPFFPSEAIPEDNVQEALENVQRQIADIVIGEIVLPNRSVEAGKLVERTLTNNELGDNCVDGRVILAGAVSEDKLGANSVSQDKIKPGAVVGEKLGPACVGEINLAQNSITAAKIKDGEVGAAKLAKNSVTAGKIKDGEVSNAKLANNSVTAGKIKDGEVSNAKLANNSVTAEKIKDGEVSNAKLANNSVTAEKIKDGEVGRSKLATEAVGAGNIEAGAVSFTIFGVLSSSSWDGQIAPYVFRIEDNRILETDEPIIDLVPSSDYETAIQEDESWGKIYRAVTGNGILTFYAKEVPGVDLPFKARCIRK